VKSRLSPGALADALEALPVRVVSLEVRQGRIAVADYPGGWRPTSVVCVTGEGHTGFGENVAFHTEEHARFAVRAADWLAVEQRAHPSERAPPRRVAAVLSSLPACLPERMSASVASLTPHERAALEAAILDLGMRQAASSLRDLTGCAAARLRFVRSFATAVDPLEPIHRCRARGYSGTLKLDVDSSWGRSTRERLAREPGIAILDFKGRGDGAFAQELAALFPAAIFEDPPPGTLPVRVSRDAVLGDARAVAEALGRGEAVNLKAPRMGGPLAMLRALELALADRSPAPREDPGEDPGENPREDAGEDPGEDPRDDPRDGPVASTGVIAYLGGMFEVGVGRAQARQLAALYCADAPNDLALNVDPERGIFGAGVAAQSSVTAQASVNKASTKTASSPMESPPVSIRLDLPGFG
jgi:hypothetical protein